VIEGVGVFVGGDTVGAGVVSVLVGVIGEGGIGVYVAVEIGCVIGIFGVRTSVEVSGVGVSLVCIVDEFGDVSPIWFKGVEVNVGKGIIFTIGVCGSASKDGLYHKSPMNRQAKAVNGNSTNSV
jgi:hypothetical protein